MASINKRTQTKFTHEGAPAKSINPTQQLRRSVMSCMLWESEFYEDGVDIADRILQHAALCPSHVVAETAIEVRTHGNLRHVPLMLLLDLIKRGGGIVSDTIAKVIQRPDELTELLALYWKDGKRPMSKQLKLGLAKAFEKFDEYQLAKYNRDGAIKLRDVLFLAHPRPANPDREALYKRLINGELKTPDTWETRLSSGADKKASFSDLLAQKKMGYMAVLRNLRNMVDNGVDQKLITDAIVARKGAHRVLPFRYVAAARAVPQLEPYIDQALTEAISEQAVLPGRTIVLVDVSASMDASLSQRSDMTRMDAACALASIVNAENLRVFSFSYDLVEVPPRKGMAGVDAVRRSQTHGGTYLGKAVHALNGTKHDRLIVITDEQSHDPVPDPVAKHAYMINVASAQNGVGYGKWTHIDGFSESVLRWISEVETFDR